MSETIIDVRQIVPAERHSQIFQNFDSLKPGMTMVIVNDHDPVPLHRELVAQRAGSFEWSYLDQGPELWQVRITRVKPAASCCGCCS